MKIFKLIIDTLMVVLMPMLMAYSLIGENNHEIIGICIFSIFIVHHALNRKWWTGIFYDNAASERSTFVKIHSERVNDKRGSKYTANYSYDSFVLGIYYPELSPGSAYPSYQYKAERQNE